MNEMRQQSSRPDWKISNKDRSPDSSQGKLGDYASDGCDSRGLVESQSGFKLEHLSILITGFWHVFWPSSVVSGVYAEYGRVHD